jgi:hypothetical protein
MMREIGVQLNPAAIACRVEAHHRIAQGRRRPVVHAQIALAAKRRQRAPHLHLDALPATGTQPKAFGGSEARRSDRGGGERADTVDRRQARILAGQRNGVESGGIASGRGPEMIECELRCHGNSQSFATKVKRVRASVDRLRLARYPPPTEGQQNWDRPAVVLPSQSRIPTAPNQS